MLTQLKKDLLFNDVGRGKGGSNGENHNDEEMDVLETEMLNDFLFKANDGKNGSGENVRSGRGEEEDAIFDAFINTDSLDGATVGASQGLGNFMTFNEDTSFQEPSFLMNSSQFDGRFGSTDTGLVSDGNSRSPSPITDSTGYHKQCQDTVENSLGFGRTEALQTPIVNPLDYVDVDEKALPYKLTVSGLPGVSRVENQIKLTLKVDPAMKQCMVHLPTDCIARQKFYLEKEVTEYPQEFQDQLIYVEAFLLCASTNKTTYVCARCVKREHRRASRRKSGLSDNVLWCNNNNRRAIIFNNKQVFVTKETDEKDRCKEFDLTARIVCYCRHHKSAEGFKILFVLKDSKGRLLAKSFTNSIVIMDKKPLPNSANSPVIAQSASNTDSGLDTAAEVFSTANSSEVPTNTSASDNNGNSEVIFNTGKYFAMTDVSPPKIEGDRSGRLAPPNAPMLSPTSMSDGGSETHGSMAEHKRESQPLASGSTPAAVARNENYQRKRPRNDALPENNMMTRRTWSNSSLSNSRSSSSSQILTQASSQLLRNMPEFISVPNPNQPSIQRVIPAQGPINGGIEITLLGTKFKDGLLVKFGENIALSTQCWSETTMVTYLPPASCAGQVFVTVLDPEDANSLEAHPSNKSIFTYVDDTDRQLIELALQIVGLKMNGKLEDARNIAKRIVGNDEGSGSLDSNISPGNISGANQMAMDKLGAQSDELLLVKVIKSLHVNSNLSMCDNLGRTLLHLAALKGYNSLCSTLIKNGARVNDKDLYGFTPLHFACVGGDVKVIRLLTECRADASIKACNSVSAKELFMSNHGHKVSVSPYFKEIADLLDSTDASDLFSSFNRKLSDSSFHSSVFENESLCSLDKSNVAHATGTDEDHSDYDESEFEEDGDESLLTGDDPDGESRCDTDSVATRANRESGRISMDNSLLNRMLHYLNDDLPKYEDLFPGSPDNEKSKIRSLELDSQSERVRNPSFTAEESQTSSEDEEDALQARFNRFFQQRQNFQNDKMLLFFWLPLTIVLVTWYVFYKFGQEDDIVHYFSRMASEYLRLIFAKILLGNERMKAAFKEHLTLFQNTGILNDFIVA